METTSLKKWGQKDTVSYVQPNCLIYKVPVNHHGPPGSSQGVLTYSLGLGVLQSLLAGYISFQYLSTFCIRIILKDLTQISCISSVLEKPILWESRAAKMRPRASLLYLNQAKNLSSKGCEHICMLKICFLRNKLSIPRVDVQMKNWSRSHLLLQRKRTDEAWETIATDLFHCLQKKQLISFCIMQRARSDGRNQNHVSISRHIQRCN